VTDEKKVSDGPNGVRGYVLCICVYQNTNSKSAISIRTFNGSKTACFPCAVALASTWDQDLMEEVGREMAAQAKAKGVQYV
jgi:beta-glucosidase